MASGDPLCESAALRVATTNGEVRSLIDTRKRKNISSNVESEIWSTPNKKRRQRKHQGLRRLIIPDSIPNHKFEELEHMLLDREEDVDRRGEQLGGLRAMLVDRDRTVRDLKNALGSHDETVRELEARAKYSGQRFQEAETLRRNERRQAEDQNDKLETKIKHMRQTIERQHQQHVADLVEVEAHHEEQETAIRLASGLLTQAHGERDELRRELGLRGDRVITTATQLPGDAGRTALESQAQRHLRVMKNLQVDLAQRDTMIKSLQSKHTAAMRAHEINTGRRISAEVRGVMNKMGSGTAKRSPDAAERADKELQAARERADAFEKRAMAAETKAEVAGRRAEQMREATEDQRKLIARLLETNRKLAGH
ncbi:hypothetical protein LTR08_007972 [Meristemomyces frigidus]|nr:hypothetical protein LTR08_007972 [Meristemomyces frigidus]